MSGERAGKSWWQTIPVMVTAIAAMIIALTGLIVALTQAGLLGSRASHDTAADAAHPISTAPQVAGAGTSAAVAASARRVNLLSGESGRQLLIAPDAAWSAAIDGKADD